MVLSGLQEQFILWLQSQGQWFIEMMRFVTALGNGHVYILAAALLYWCFDRRFGARLFLIFMLTASINALLKAAIHAPRPYWVNEHIVGVNKHSSFGMPSGHSQSAATVLGTAACTWKRGWFYVAAGVFILLMGFTRIVLGVHYPGQVLAGFCVGLLVVWASMKAEDPLLGWLKKRSAGIQVASILLTAAVLLGIGLALTIGLSDFRFSPLWVKNAPDSFSARNLAVPVSLRSVTNATGTFCGFGLGVILEHHRKGRGIQGLWWQKTLRVLLGSAVVLGLWYAAGLAKPQGRLALNLYRFFGTAITGFWISGLAPLVFDKMGLTSGHNSGLNPNLTT